MDCRATPAHKWRVKVGLKQYDAILTKTTIGADKNNEFIWRRKDANTM